MKKQKNKPRYPIGTAVNVSVFKRLEIVRGFGYTIPELLEMGIAAAEKIVIKDIKQS
jgi:hypothetical protein